MFSKAKYYMGIGKPKNQHSLDNLKYLYGVLNKNQIVTENNKDLLIETLRSISEILIWGDQNDSSVFDFFLERQMITFFLHYMKQKYGRYICVQLLQTLNILFENIRNETSLYFLLSNNHINNIIVHKFDFSDEEVMAYYISFLKTLSLKLNSHSIHFFFNERIAEFPLYVEAIKFFDHPESMVRIAVRTLTLNVYRVKVPSMQRFIAERTAAHYFANLVWLMRNHVLDLDLCVKNTTDHTKRFRLTDLIDENIDHFNYLQDIYMIQNTDLSTCLTEELIRRLLVPICLSSIVKKDKYSKDRKPSIQQFVSLFVLTHIFSIITYEPLLTDLCELIFYINDEQVLDQMCSSRGSVEIDYLSEPRALIHCLSSLGMFATASTAATAASASGYQQPLAGSSTITAKSRSHSVPHFSSSQLAVDESNIPNVPSAAAAVVEERLSTLALNHHVPVEIERAAATESAFIQNMEFILPVGDGGVRAVNAINNIDDSVQQAAAAAAVSVDNNITDDEKYRQIVSNRSNFAKNQSYGIVFESILQNLNSQDYDEMNSMIALSFIFTLINNTGVSSKFHEILSVRVNKNHEVVSNYNEAVVNKLIGIVAKSVEPEFKVRLATLELAIKLIKSLVIVNKRSYINDFHLACIEQAREQSAFILRQKFKSEEMFLDMFEHEYQELNSQVLNFEVLLRDWSILLAPTSTPLSNIEFTRRFPCGDTERLKQAMRVFFLVRNLGLCLVNQNENHLPLTKQEALVKENDALDLNSSDLIACTVNLKDKRDRRFLVIDPIQFILVEPEVKRIGWGIVKFSDLVQDVEVSPDKEDSRSLNINIKKSNLNGKPEIVLNSVFTFDDHIRCMAAKQHLVRARDRARRMKLEKIAQLLDINTNPLPSSVHNTSGGAPKSTFVSAAPSSDIINYNLVAGRASMISSTWSQITQPEKGNPIMSSPMAALTSSPLIRNTSVPTPGLFKFQSSPLGADASSSSSASFDSSTAASRVKSPDTAVDKLTKAMLESSLSNSTAEKIERRRSSNTDLQTVLAKSLISNNDQAVSLIQTSFSDTDQALASKIQILPPSEEHSDSHSSVIHSPVTVKSLDDLLK